jgi:segregation and condensation protein A
MSEYRVNLDIYNGPLDLLLYLIRREEVDIYDIPIAHITKQYIEYVEILQQVDPNIAGDFLVMAATLIEVKTRMLLPAAPAEEGDEDLEDLDPRAELVRQLLQYKAFKDAAGDLTEIGQQQEKRHPRAPVHPDFQSDQAKDLEDVQIWDLFDAFSRLMEEVGQVAPTHDVIYDDTPIATHAENILETVRAQGSVRFTSLFGAARSRSEIIGLFLALLELTRQKLILCRQDLNFADIRIDLNPDPPAEEEDETASTPPIGEDITG